MNKTYLLAYFGIAWLAPLLFVSIVIAFTPDPNLTRDEFSSATFEPDSVWIVEKDTNKGQEYYEFLIRSPAGETYIHRAPELEPIEALKAQFPSEGAVNIVYDEGVEGNVLMEIAIADQTNGEKVLSFESVMDEYASRRQLVYIISGVWCILANLAAFALWKVDLTGPEFNSA